MPWEDTLLLHAMLTITAASALQVSASGWTLELADAALWGDAAGGMNFPSSFEGHLMLASREQGHSYHNVEDGVVQTEYRGLLAYAGSLESAWFKSIYSGEVIDTPVGTLPDQGNALLERTCDPDCPAWNVEEHAVSIWEQGSGDNWIVDALRPDPRDPTRAALTTLYTDPPSGNYWFRCGRVTVEEDGTRIFEDVFAQDGYHCWRLVTGPDGHNCAVLAEDEAFNAAEILGDRFGCWNDDGDYGQLLDLEPADRLHQFWADWSEELGSCGGFVIADEEILYTLTRDSCEQPDDSDTPDDSDSGSGALRPGDLDDEGCGCSSQRRTRRAPGTWLLLIIGLTATRRRQTAG